MCATRRKSPLICKRCFVITRKSVSASKTQSRMTSGRTINCKDVALRDQLWNVLGFNVFKYALKVKKMMKKKKRQFFIFSMALNMKYGQFIPKINNVI